MGEHPIDPTPSGAQVDCFDGSLHGARVGSVQEFLEKNAPADENQSALCCDLSACWIVV
jgi:hypothetical protein